MEKSIIIILGVAIVLISFLSIIWIYGSLNEKFAHYPPYREENGPYYGWQDTGINSLTSPNGFQYEKLDTSVAPTQGIDIHGSRFGPGFLSPPGRWWDKVSELGSSIDIKEKFSPIDLTKERENFSFDDSDNEQFSNDSVNERGKLSPIVLTRERENSSPDYSAKERERNYPREKFEHASKDPREKHSDVLIPTLKRTKESSHTGWDNPIYDRYRDPMLKTSMGTTRDKYPEWPLSYEYPYRDPLYSMMTTGLYTAANSDPEDLYEQRMWPRAL